MSRRSGDHLGHITRQNRPIASPQRPESPAKRDWRFSFDIQNRENHTWHGKCVPYRARANQHGCPRTGTPGSDGT